MIDINEMREAIQAFGSQAINEGDLNELLNRLEEAEKDIILKERIIDSLGSTLNAVANGRDEPRAAVCHEADCVEACKAEIKALRAKIEQMEQQEPVARTVGGVTEWVSNGDGTYSLGGCLEAFAPLPDDAQLYPLPGAQPAPSVPDISDDMIEAIESRAEQSYRRRHSGIHGQQITPADALSWHIIHATRSVLVEAMETSRAP